MSLIHPDKKKVNNLKRVAALLAAVAAAGIMLWRLNRDGSANDPIDPALQSGNKTLNETQFIKGQEDAAGAAIAGNPVTGTITQRPDFVSDLEWKILKNAASRRSIDNDKELTRLINKLLFAKKREAWLASSVDTARRQALAGQLLNMLPAQVQTGSLDPAEAKKMEGELNEGPGKAGPNR